MLQQVHRRAAPDYRTGWKDWFTFIWSVKNHFDRHRLSLIAAGVAFYTMMAIFPGLAALISLWGLIAEPGQVTAFMDEFHGPLPEDAYSILRKQAVDIASKPEGPLTLGFIFSVGFATFSASAGIKALIKGLNIVHGEHETRGFIKLNAVALGLTFFLVFAVMVCLAVILAAPPLLRLFLPDIFVSIWEKARWPLLFCAAIATISTLYRFGPCCARPRWQWFSAGSMVATLLWLLASAGFSFYASNYGNYNETYGSIGAVIILLMWFWLSALVILLGAELNSEIERRKRS